MAEKAKLPLGSVVESIEMGRLIEAEQRGRRAATSKERATLVLRLHTAKMRGDPPDVIADMYARIRALSQEPRSRETAAAAVGLQVQAYQRGKLVMQAAEKDPARYGDLVPLLEKSPAHAYAELRKRRGDPPRIYKSKAASENPLLRRGLRPQHDAMMDRAVQSLQGAVMGLQLVEHDQLDRTKLAPWLAAFTETAAYLHKLHKELIKLYDEE